MANVTPQNLLDKALDGKRAVVSSTSPRGGRMILVEDCVETSGAFVLHHLLNRSLSPSSSDVVVFLSFAHPFSHYDRILCKMRPRKNKRGYTYFIVWRSSKAVEASLSHENRRPITVIIDDVSLMKVDANGSSNLVLDFLHYCYSLTAQFGCSLITLNHDDVYSTMDRPTLLLQMEYLADVVIKVEPLATGLATDVHGLLTVTNKGLQDDSGKSRNTVKNYHFRIKDSSVEYFYLGSKT